MSTRTLRRCQRAAIEAGVLIDTGKRSRQNYPIFIIDFQMIDEFRQTDELKKEVEQKMRASLRKPIDPDDAKEEQEQYAADEQGDYDQVEDAPFDPFDGDMTTTTPVREVAGC
jgi:hypothetical protein